MSLKTFHFISEIVSSSIAFTANFVLIYLIKKHTTDELKPYSRILLQNCFVDLFFASIIAISFFQLEVDDGVFIMMLSGPLHNLQHPWHFFVLILYAFGLYFCVMCAAIPFYYRFVLICRHKVMSLKRFYLLYVFAAFVSFTFQIVLFFAFAPSVFGSNLEFRRVLDNDFWRNKEGSLPIFVASNMGNPFFVILDSYGFVLVTGTYSLIIWYSLKIWRTLKETRSLMSAKTRKIQKNLNYTLIAQAIVPLIGADLPMMTIICTALFKLKVDHLSVFMISACSWITALNPLCAICIVGPYRDAILRRNRVSDIRINTDNGQRSHPTRNTTEMLA